MTGEICVEFRSHRILVVFKSAPPISPADFAYWHVTDIQKCSGDFCP
jgi:hypothetical protein